MPAAGKLEDAVIRALRQTLLGSETLALAVAEANEQSVSRMEPLRADLARKRRELAKVDREGRELYERVRSDGLSGIPWAEDDLRRLTGQREDLKRSIRVVQAELDAESHRQVDSTCIEEALADLDRIWPHLTGPEAKELIGLLVREVRVHAGGTMDIDLYEGRTLRSAMPPKEKPRGGGVNQPGAGFVSGTDWLRQ